MRIRSEERGRSRGVIIDAKALEDPDLSFRAKGLLAYLQSLSGDRVPDVKDLTTASLEKKTAIKTALKELEDKGYLTGIEEVGADGTPGFAKDVQAVIRKPLMENLFDDLSRLEGPAKQRPSRKKAPAASAKKTETKRRVGRVIDHLNLLRERSWDWAQYTPLSAKYAKNVEHISGRLRDGYDEQDLILVLDYLAAVDGGKEESRRYFNCVTPFNTKNFERNLAMACNWEACGRPPQVSSRSLQAAYGHDSEIYERRVRGGRK